MSQPVQMSAQERIERFTPCPCEGEKLPTTHAAPRTLRFDERKLITLDALGDGAPARPLRAYRRPAWIASEQPVAFVSRQSDTQELFLLGDGNEFLPFVEQEHDPAACGRLVLFTSDGDQDVEVYALTGSRELVAVDRR